LILAKKEIKKRREREKNGVVREEDEAPFVLILVF
jgi:hypothetical protein